LLRYIAAFWAKSGYRVSVVAGLGKWPDGDIAILHVDLSVIPVAYVEASKRYPVVLNAATTDIRKRQVSRNIVGPNDGWRGPVILKTDLNNGGGPERRIMKWMRLSMRGTERDLPVDATSLAAIEEYRIVDSASQVPDAVWTAPGLVVERFLPERDERGYAMRAWVFLGDRERCTRYLATDPLVKSANIVASEAVPVPDEMRAERRRLGFDYGKFDFTLCDGQPVLLDANRTPWSPPASARTALAASNADLAHGLHACLPGP
jgi:hypothetical protein